MCCKSKCQPKCQPKCGYNFKVAKPCVINCPEISPTPTFTTVTVSGVTTTESIVATNAVIDVLSSDVGVIDTLTVEDITIIQTLGRTQNNVVTSSFLGSVDIVIPPEPLVPWAELDTPPIGVFPGFVDGVMALSGQSGFLSFTFSNALAPTSPILISVLKNGVAPINVVFQDEIEDVNTVSFTLPVFSTDTSVAVSIGGAALEPPNIFSTSILQM